MLSICSNQVKPLRESYRLIQGAHLLYDVLTYNPPEIKNAVLFATKSVLVCETADDAMRVAYGTKNKPLDVGIFQHFFFYYS